MSSQRSERYLLGGLRSLELTMSHLLEVDRSDRAKKALARRFKDFAFTAYPFAPKLTHRVLSHAAKLGFGDFMPTMPTATGRLMATLLGWKIARRASLWKAQLKKTQL